jgi:RNA polymerase sigma factor (sigma-70 family)
MDKKIRKKYIVRIQNTPVEVSEEVYSTYYSVERHTKTLNELDARHRLTFYQAMDTDEILGEDTIPDSESESVENMAVKKVMIENLRKCLLQLPKHEQELIYSLYFEEMSERKLAEKTGTHNMTIHDRRVKILEKLRKML